ncbi:histidine phosphatase family protein [Bartonella sp. HY329]|uniref:SixA phosphatase family protein n=1 Tax=unclassified Bartonella TaxID=2645622 RepID=UPI0021C98AB8|nr:MULTISPECIES: histidine phosphatase family protein [unclassified Bartonella]UXM96209.1 histidine phosphatase family protein [Bartonella sp. HY329]UXN10533.1 histidine phosphatase family protein [Bartonella sp. HY328]
MTHLQRIFLLRHAEAMPAQKGQTDFDRCLSAQGLHQAANIGTIIGQDYQRPAKVLLSPSKRTSQTVETLQLFDQSDLIFIDDLYDGGPQDYLNTVKNHSQYESVLLVGHNPSIFALLQFLAAPKSKIKLPYSYPTAGLAVLDFAKDETEFNHHCGNLLAFHQP